ncbi:MAG TPA: hypothetical protein VFZ25_20735 [Chloroflexota bacterium]|nr:hypothetical protein [Chloroflexota bacterium]
MPRYITRLFVTDDQKTLNSVCSIDGTRFADVKVTAHAGVLHVSKWWSYWSDGMIIRRESAIKENRQCLSEDAVKLIEKVINADSGQVNRGLGSLGQVAANLAQETLLDTPSQRRGKGRQVTLARWTVLLTNRSQADLYIVSEKYAEGYTFDVYWSREEAERDLVVFGVTPTTQATA